VFCTLPFYRQTKNRMASRKQTKPTKGRRPAQKRDLVKAEHARVVALTDNTSLDTRTVVRRMALLGTLATNGSGFIAATQYQSSGVTSCYDWSGMSGRYLEYRVRAIRIRIYPLANMNYANGTVVPPVMILAADIKAGVGFVNASALACGANLRVFRGYGTHEPIDITTDWEGYPDAHLWTGTSGSIAATDTFGVQLQDSATAPASAASTVYFRVLQEYVVEFRLPA
jgi:hypothetical protein